MQLDEIFYQAIKADATITALVEDRIKSTCFEVPPDGDEDTEVPYIIITDDGFQNQNPTKDTLWEAAEDQVQISLEIAANNPHELKMLRRRTRKAIEQYIASLYAQGESIPELTALTSYGLQWDWEKPCYFQILTYQCIIEADIDDEQED